MADVVSILDELQNKALKDEKLKQQLLATRTEARRLRTATSRINTAFFVTYKQITPPRIWYNRVD